MTIALDPDAIRSAWQVGAVQGRGELDAADGYLAAARGTDMVGLTGCLATAADALSDVAATGRALIDELGDAVEGCLALWETTDHQTVGQLHALEDAL